jgi:hypothetical protein
MKIMAGMNCPRCDHSMTPAFAHAAATIPYVTPEQILKFAHVSGDVHQVPLWKRFLPHAAEYFVTHLCGECGIYIIDIKHTLSSAEAKELAQILTR